MSTIDPYIRTLFFRDITELKLPSAHSRREELTPRLRKTLNEVLSAQGASSDIANLEYLSDSIFDELVEADVISIEDHGFAGSYYVFDKAKYLKFRESVLVRNPIYLAAQRVDSRYFRDVFEGYLGQRNSEYREDAIRGSIEIPASDRVVSIGDNIAPIVDELEQLKSRLSFDNDPEGKLVDKRERLVSEISAGQELLKSPSVRLKAIYTVLISTLGFIATEFAGGVIGDLAVKLLEQIKPLVGL